MKKIAIIFVSLIVFSVSFANAANEETESATNESAVMTTTVSGKVLDKITGESLVGVKVTVEGVNKSVYTDFDGNFEIDGVREGNFEITTSYISYKKQVETVNVCLAKANTVDVQIESITE